MGITQKHNAQVCKHNGLSPILQGQSYQSGWSDFHLTTFAEVN